MAIGMQTLLEVYRYRVANLGKNVYYAIVSTYCVDITYPSCCIDHFFVYVVFIAAILSRLRVKLSNLATQALLYIRGLGPIGIIGHLLIADDIFGSSYLACSEQKTFHKGTRSSRPTEAHIPPFMVSAFASF